MNSTEKGDIEEQRFVLFCVERQIPISKPITNSLPYDFIIEFNNKLFRIQVKKSTLESKNIIIFPAYSTVYTAAGYIKKKYGDKIDYYVTYWDNKFFFVPAKEVLTLKFRICIAEKIARKDQNHYSQYILFE